MDRRRPAGRGSHRPGRRGARVPGHARRRGHPQGAGGDLPPAAERLASAPAGHPGRHERLHSRQRPPRGDRAGARRHPPQRALRRAHGRAADRERPPDRGPADRHPARQRERLHPHRLLRGGAPALRHPDRVRRADFPLRLARHQPDPPVARPRHLRAPLRAEALGQRDPQPQPGLPGARRRPVDRAGGLRDRAADPWRRRPIFRSTCTRPRPSTR